MTTSTTTDATYAGEWAPHRGMNLFQRINLAQCALDRSRLPGVVVTERWSGEYDSAKLWGKTMATSAIF
jgi:hypothetical protein